MKLAYGFIIAVLLLLASFDSTVAHHSAAAYDVGSVVRIDGTVASFDWGNPHVYLELDEAVTDSDEPRRWLVELAHPGTVSRFGVDSGTLKAGDEISILVNPPRNVERSIASLVSLEKDGVTLIDNRNMNEVFQPMFSQLATQPAESIEGVWAPPLDALQQAGLGDTGALNLTEAARIAADEFDAQAAQAVCQPDPIPSGMLAASSPTFLSIEVAEDAVTIRREAESMRRVIRLDTTEHSDELSPYGDSIGRWDGDTLVVATIGFEPHPEGIAPRVPSGTEKRLVERFELNADRTGLIYSFELNDPEYLVGTIEGAVEWLHWSGAELDQVPCTDENAQRFLSE